MAPEECPRMDGVCKSKPLTISPRLSAAAPSLKLNLRKFSHNRPIGNYRHLSSSSYSYSGVSLQPKRRSGLYYRSMASQPLIFIFETCHIHNLVSLRRKVKVVFVFLSRDHRSHHPHHNNLHASYPLDWDDQWNPRSITCVIDGAEDKWWLSSRETQFCRSRFVVSCCSVMLLLWLSGRWPGGAPVLDIETRSIVNLREIQEMIVHYCGSLQIQREMFHAKSPHLIWIEKQCIEMSVFWCAPRGDVDDILTSLDYLFNRGHCLPPITPHPQTTNTN